MCILGLGKFHALLLFCCGTCLMSTIVETLNIGFVIPLIEMECEMTLSLSHKGILNSAALFGDYSYEIIEYFINYFFERRNCCQLIFLGVLS